MGRKAQIAIAAAVVAIFGLGVGIYLYDDSQKDEIAEGVTINGVDVGGMTAEQAESTLRHEILAPLRKPVTVTYRDRTFSLAAGRLDVRAAVDESVERALEESREGGLPTRVVRGLTGGELSKNVKLELAYSRSAINKFVRRIAEKLGRDPQDASVDPSPSSLEVVEARNGRKLRDNLLTEELVAAVSHGGDRNVVAETHPVKPDISTSEVAERYPDYLTLDRSTYTLRYWKDLKLAETYTVAVGQQGLETPAGIYSIQNKQVDPVWTVPNSAWAGDMAGQVVPGGTPENPLKARWMGIFDGAGIHGTDDVSSLGQAASHGCVRMAIPDVIDLYDRVEVGTPIYIG